MGVTAQVADERTRALAQTRGRGRNAVVLLQAGSGVVCRATRSTTPGSTPAAESLPSNGKSAPAS
jgi:hypothetical protein